MSKLYENNCDISNPEWSGWANLNFGTIMSQGAAYGKHGQGIRVVAPNGALAYIQSAAFGPVYTLAVGFWFRLVSFPTGSSYGVRVLTGSDFGYFLMASKAAGDSFPRLRLDIDSGGITGEQLAINTWTWVRIAYSISPTVQSARLLYGSGDNTKTGSPFRYDPESIVTVGPRYLTYNDWEYHIDHFIVGTDLADVAEPVYASPRRRMMMGVGK